MNRRCRFAALQARLSVARQIKPVIRLDPKQRLLIDVEAELPLGDRIDADTAA